MTKDSLAVLYPSLGLELASLHWEEVFNHQEQVLAEGSRLKPNSAAPLFLGVHTKQLNNGCGE